MNKKPSGYQYRKRKAEKDKESKKQEGAFLKYLCQEDHQKENVEILNTTSEETVTETTTRVIKSSSTVVDIVEVDSEAEYSTGTLGIDNMKERQINFQNLSYDDPATWSKLKILNIDKLCQLLVEHGPKQIYNFDFPKDNSRRFSTTHYTRKLFNGETIQRSWLIYSKSTDSAFCFCCLLFDHWNINIADSGLKDWKNISSIINTHEKTQRHVENYLKWKELEIRIKKHKTIDEQNLRVIKKEEKHWLQVLERLFSLVKTLAVHNLSFRGTNETLFAHGNGNLLQFVEFLAKFDPIMNEHLKKVKDKETYVHYLGKDVQNEIIEIISDAIKKKILDLVSATKYFSITADCTPDIAHMEQYVLWTPLTIQFP